MIVYAYVSCFIWYLTKLCSNCFLNYDYNSAHQEPAQWQQIEWFPFFSTNIIVFPSRTFMTNINRWFDVFSFYVHVLFPIISLTFTVVLFLYCTVCLEEIETNFFSRMSMGVTRQMTNTPSENKIERGFIFSEVENVLPNKFYIEHWTNCDAVSTNNQNITMSSTVEW